MQVLDLDGLPEFARRELLDFYQFLQQKYAFSQNKTSNQGQKDSTPLAPRLVEPFEPISRDKLYER